MGLPDTRKLDADKSICVGKLALDEAVDLLSRFDPDVHHLEDTVLSIAEAISGNLYRCRGKTVPRHFRSIPRTLVTS